MFAKFNMKSAANKYADYHTYGKDQIDEIKKMVHQKLDDYLLNDGSLDATAMENDWFPNVNKHVFLSHSHADEWDVTCFAGYLWKEYKISSFIDSIVWGYADNLLKQIDDKYCITSTDATGKNTYSYEKRNRTTTQVYLLLQGALAKMIDHCECLIFVNTPNSIKPSDVSNTTNTESPWIYSEILMASTFPTRSYKEYRTSELCHFDAKVTYNLNLTSFVDLDTIDLILAKIKSKDKTPEGILEQLFIDKSILVRG